MGIEECVSKEDKSTLDLKCIGKWYGDLKGSFINVHFWKRHWQ